MQEVTKVQLQSFACGNDPFSFFFFKFFVLHLRQFIWVDRLRLLMGRLTFPTIMVNQVIVFLNWTQSKEIEPCYYVKKTVDWISIHRMVRAAGGCETK